MEATSSMSSRQRWKESQASPLGASVPESGLCSQAHQSLLTLPPSIWWAAVAVPHVNPSGKARSPVPASARLLLMAPHGSGRRPVALGETNGTRETAARAVACDDHSHERLSRLPRQPAESG